MSKWNKLIFGLLKCCLPFTGSSAEARTIFHLFDKDTEVRESVREIYDLSELFVTASNITDARCFSRVLAQ